MLQWKKDINFFKSSNCERGHNSANKKVFLYGDSHSASLAPPIREYFFRNGYDFSEYETSYCVPLALQGKDRQCRDINSYVYKKIAEIKPEKIILFAFYSYRATEPDYQEAIPYDSLILESSKKFIKDGVKEVIIVGPMPVWKSELRKILIREYISNRVAVPKRTYAGIDDKSLKFDELMKSKSLPPGIRYVSLKDHLCNSDGCLVSAGDNLASDIMVWDYGHLTLPGANLIFNKVLKDYFSNETPR